MRFKKKLCGCEKISQDGYDSKIQGGRVNGYDTKAKIGHSKSWVTFIQFWIF